MKGGPRIARRRKARPRERCGVTWLRFVKAVHQPGWTAQKIVMERDHQRQAGFADDGKYAWREELRPLLDMDHRIGGIELRQD